MAKIPEQGRYDLILDQVLNSLRYDPDTGIFVWKRSRGSKNKGSVAGNYRKADGYYQIGLFGNLYLTHQLAWMYMTGEMPPDGMEIDHISTVRSDNRWVNLRLATISQNRSNGTRQPGLSGFRGVYRHTKNLTWLANVKHNGKTTRLGSFTRKEDAIAAYQRFALKVKGEFFYEGAKA